MNLMLFTGMPQEGWRDCYYTTQDEITAPEKALAKWARLNDDYRCTPLNLDPDLSREYRADSH